MDAPDRHAVESELRHHRHGPHARQATARSPSSIPSTWLNGFYQLLLTARDLSGRTTQTQTTIEIDTTTKPNDYVVTDTDVSVTLDGATVPIQRTYDALTRDGGGDFGNGWRFVNAADEPPDESSRHRPRKASVFTTRSATAQMFI